MLENGALMSNSENAIETRNTFASVDGVVKTSIGKDVEAHLISGVRFWGKLEWVDDIWIIIRGYRGQPITIRKSKVAALVEVV
jgi:hypothetical protein